MTEPLIVSLDVGTSSVRTLLFDGRAREVDGFGKQIPYQVRTTPDGGVEVDADELVRLAAESISEMHLQLSAANLQPRAVASCTFWHNVLGVDAGGAPVTPVIHLFDTRSADAARRLATKIDGRAQHARTGCVLHPSYLPSKLLWLSETDVDRFLTARRWMSFGEYLFLKLFGTPSASTSMLSGSGLWNQHLNDYDDDLLNVLPVDRAQLARPKEIDQPQNSLLDPYRAQWPRLHSIPWYPALGDGACNNVGSGCITPDRFSLMVGTSGAMRAVVEASEIEIPEGLWCYRVDRRRYVLGGALSNGGEVFAWMKRTLALGRASNEEIEKQLAAIAPGSHGLTVLPLFAGERSTGWRADARAAITGMSLTTGPIEILRASLESVALRFRNIYDVMSRVLGAPKEVVASGGALLHSPAWTQMMADALGHAVIPCLEKEASGRGAALLALERLGAIQHIGEPAPEMGPPVLPVAANHEIYDAALRQQRRLYTKLFEEN